MSDPFIGEIRIFPYTFAPRSWAYCSGQQLPISQNTTLYAVIGINFGGDGRTTLQVPNLDGRGAMGKGHGPGLTMRNIGDIHGFPTAQLQTSQLPSHKHALYSYNGKSTQGTPSPTVMTSKDNVGSVNLFKKTPVNSTVPMAQQALSVTGNNVNPEHENRQPYICTPYFIALDGVFPPRN